MNKCSNFRPGALMADKETASAKPEPLMVYWQPGCTGCLRTKEFLTNHGVPFVSIVEAFLHLAENGKRLEIAAYNQDVPPHVASAHELVAFVHQVQQRFDEWWKRDG